MMLFTELVDGLFTLESCFASYCIPRHEYIRCDPTTTIIMPFLPLLSETTCNVTKERKELRDHRDNQKKRTIIAEANRVLW